MHNLPLASAFSLTGLEKFQFVLYLLSIASDPPDISEETCIQIQQNNSLNEQVCDQDELGNFFSPLLELHIYSLAEGSV